ncbi:Pyrroline-5-carboxylate reductase [Poriferisphaera corsica]|uniref:Pyrroline-5-carboxylate reductase n=1 Tax=Poriferisphaera corsica TaxID=2528020 RepID=A0A517YTR5_9BACT|nr:pyrroline-5-carboxylate reductase [Poriferisphaera corsica]QDU33621.1 Pyrroline-5-carboxylate reductase [Poriferisphaera corsica]
MQYKLAFIGAGNMAEAIARSAISSGTLTPDQIIAADPSPDRRDLFASIGLHVTPSSSDAAAQAEQIMFAFKPQMMNDALSTFASSLTPAQTIISIMAGISSEKIHTAITNLNPQADGIKVVRVMPNTPIMVNYGMAGVSLGQNTNPGDDDFAFQLFNAATNKAVRVTEEQLHLITAISGSGPAYIFFIAEALQQAAKDIGLPEHAHELVTQTILGSALLMNQSPDSPAELRRKVTSPKGTTEAAINKMTDLNLPNTIEQGAAACLKRSIELGNL